MRALLLLWLAATLGSALQVLSTDALAASEETLVDRVVAVVDEDPIFLSDLQRAIGLGLARARPGESRDALMRRVLDGLIDERLRLHEIQRFEFGPLPPAELDAQVETVRQSFSSPEAYRKRLRELGIGDHEVRQTLARQLRVLVYIEQRLRPRVFVDFEEIQAYYEGELATAMEQQGTPLPPLAEVQEEIRQLLHEKALNREITAWTDRLRLESSIEDLWSHPEGPLPPILEVIETPVEPEGP